MLAALVSWVYLVVLAGLGLVGLHRLHLLGLVSARLADPRPREPPEPRPWPRVCVQLPLYDEANVAARLIDAVAALDYPRDHLEVQVLDDSDDETAEICAERVAHHRRRGLSIAHLRRGARSGYKAGALAYGLSRTDAPLIAIFDADFVPPPEFLRQTVPHFREPELGLVQARWEHLNRGASLLTRVQALGLDAHFRVEQRARSLSRRFFNFNGTAGVFRRLAIETAGGWASDTVTEDLDLSLRAQLCGWSFRYLDDVSVPAELPADLGAFRTQQRRWARGAGQTARKLLGEVWRAPDVLLRARLEASCQLLMNAAYPLVLLLALLTVPLVVAGAGALLMAHWALFVASTGSVSLFYLASQSHRGARGVLEALVLLPALFALGMGLSLSTGLAYLAGLLCGGEVPFVRTPKAGAGRRRYAAQRTPSLAWAELGLGVYALAGAALAVVLDRPVALPFLALVAAGFLAVGGRSLLPGQGPRAIYVPPEELGPPSLSDPGGSRAEDATGGGRRQVVERYRSGSH